MKRRYANSAPLPGPGGRGKRQRQTIRCCGIVYARWRFVGKEFPMTHATVCTKCLGTLHWPAYREPNRPEVARERWRDYAVDRLSRGLRTDGKPRVREFITREESKRRMLARYHARARQRMETGLTSRGTEPVYRRRISESESAWQQFRAAMPAPVVEFQTNLERGE